MKNKNIFENNVTIPDIVQQKANAAFTTIYNRQDEPDEKPQKTHKPSRAAIIKIASTVVVAAITVAVLFVAIAYFGGRGPEHPALSTGIGVIDKQFSIMVCAAELEPKASLPISLDVSNQSFGYGCDWTGYVNFQINFPISVEGDNISDVTFKSDNAVFEVVSIDCPSIVKSGSTKTLPDFKSTYAHGNDMSGYPIGKTEVGYYDSFSADYGTLQNSKYLFNICNVLTDRMDLYYLLCCCHEVSADDECAIYTYLVKDVKVTIEVTFKDGTTSSRSLGLFSKQYLATDKLEDGTEYQYMATQIFCYDENNVDDATKQLISSQITRATEIWKAEAAKDTSEATTTTDETVDETEASDSTETTVTTETTVNTETTVSTETTASSETTESTETSVSSETTVSTESSADTEPTVSTEEPKITDEVSSTENTEI